VHFESFAEFIAMGQHGPYVWSAFGSAVVLLVANTWLAQRRYKKVKKTLAQQYRRQSMQESE